VEDIERRIFFSTTKVEFIDRKILTNEEPVDVIIPIISSNLFFEQNLYSFYREIPINRLIIGDGGVIDDSKEILKKFPRVKIIDQKNLYSLGYRITELISIVETEWFIYLHADVYLPENWFDTMKKYQNTYDWYECDKQYVVFIEYKPSGLKSIERALSGSQMGRKKAFENIIPKIDDDYLYRNEDIILKELIFEEGFKYGRVFDTFHHHQITNQKVESDQIKNVIVHKTQEKDFRTVNMQVRAIIKYCKPRKEFIRGVNLNLKFMFKRGYLNIKEFLKWVENTNKIWLKHLRIKDPLYIKILKIIKKSLYPKLLKILKLK